jgi:hypothetical protein
MLYLIRQSDAYTSICKFLLSSNNTVLLSRYIDSMATQAWVMAATPGNSTPQYISSDSDNGRDSETEETPPISAATTLRRKRPRKSRDVVWLHARKPIQGVEAIRELSGKDRRRVWYCKDSACEKYSVLNVATARAHMLTKHGIVCDPSLPEKKIAREGDIRTVFSEQQLTNKYNEEQKTKEALRNSVDRKTVHQALLRLIVYHDLPLSTVEWPELHTLVFAINYMATDCLWTAHKTTARHLAKTFKERRHQVARILQGAQSLIHITTDTWHSPNFKELQAITAHFIDDTGRRQKALIALPELLDGHAGVKVAGHIVATLEAYKIKDKLGYITADNHRANDTMCRALSEQLPEINWQPVQQRLRCIGHMLNIAIQAFFYAKDEDAVKLAIEESERSGASIDEELFALSRKDTS